MVDYILNRDENGMVRYLYGKDKRYPYVGKTKWESARWLLENDKSRELRMSEEYEGFPLTADGVYFFDGKCLEDDTPVPTCGPDYCEIPDIEVNQYEGKSEELNNKPKSKKRADKGR